MVTFTDIADAPQAGAMRIVVFNDAHTVTDNAAIEMNGNTNYTGAAGDVFLVEAKTTSTFRWTLLAHGDRTLKTLANTSDTGVVELAEESEVEADTPSTSLVPSIDSLRSGFLVHKTYTATTSGTSATFSGIPSWVKKFSIFLAGVSTNGTSGVMLRLGWVDRDWETAS